MTVERTLICDGCGSIMAAFAPGEDRELVLWLLEHEGRVLYDKHYCAGCTEQLDRREDRAADSAFNEILSAGPARWAHLGRTA